ncbi:MAG: cbb3-type cytochrome oxidase assembly protein CcoS [Dechloromonas sp.]|jgi:cbb3-type cytochrome oxidase maturation protein|nr:MAG: cbb3-type cytochrome oxidase assembly protein CcoS [Dechloromonas sp.]
MSVLIYLVPVSLILLGLAFWAFWWAVKRGQFDNLDTPAIDILTTDEREAPLRDPRHSAASSESANRAD